MEYVKFSPPWKANSCLATHEITIILCKTEVHYSIHKSPLLPPVLCHMNPAHVLPSYCVILPSTPRSSYKSLSFRILHQIILYTSLFHACYIACPLQPPLCVHSNTFWRGVQMEVLITLFYSGSYDLYPLRYRYSPLLISAAFQLIKSGLESTV